MTGPLRMTGARRMAGLRRMIAFQFSNALVLMVACVPFSRAEVLDRVVASIGEVAITRSDVRA